MAPPTSADAPPARSPTTPPTTVRKPPVQSEPTDGLAPMDMPPTAAELPPRRWGKAIWIGAIAGLIIGMLAMVLIFSRRTTPEPETPFPTPRESPRSR